MPKMKTRKAAAKRFKAVGNGKLKRRKQGLRHILEKRSQKSKKNAGSVSYVSRADMKQVKRMLAM